MIHQGASDRRQLLRQSGLLWLSGLSVSAGLGAGCGTAVAASSSSLNTVGLYGSVTPVFDQLMKEGKYYEQFGIDVEQTLVSDGSKIIAALLSGQADLSTGSGFAGVFPAIERGAKFKIVAGVFLAPQDVIFSKNPEIRSAKDLVGKTLAIGPFGAQLHELTLALMIKKGVDYSKVKFVNIGAISDTFKAVVAGTVDAGFGTADVYFNQEQYGVHSLSDGVMWDELPEYTEQAMLASDTAIAEKRDLLVKILAARAKMFRFVASPDSKEAWIKARAIAIGKDAPKEAEAQWKFFSAPGMLATNLVLTPQRFDFIQNLNVQVGAQQKALPTDQFADMSIAQDALKLLG